ncbi:hypothetical protein HZB04_00480 [Candidatus Wolfebacteria bacterium]|nr:hypothetical protein [Candidatus Wolfebacteria bacterium]
MRNLKDRDVKDFRKALEISIGRKNSFILCFYRIELWIKDICYDIKMFYALWRVIPIDCRVELIKELIFIPKRLRERYLEEVKFQDILKNSFKK